MKNQCPHAFVRPFANACPLFLQPRPILCLLFLILPPLFPQSANAFDTSQDIWSVLGGYGESYPGWGRTTERVRTIDLSPRYSHLTIDHLGSSWYAGYHTTLIELPVHVVTSPDTSAMVGVNFLACYTFIVDDRWHPYIFGGGGPVYSFADIPGMGAHWNGNYQFGLGLEYLREHGKPMLFEIRYHHISNVGTEDPNVPLNGLKFKVGFTF